MAKVQTRSAAALGALVMSLAAAAHPAAAQAQSEAGFFAGKTVSVIIGFGPGGGYDLSARVLSRHMGKHLPGKPQIIARNMPGGGSLRAANYIYSLAPKDGTEFGVFGRTVPIDPLLGNAQAKFDPLRFTWLGSSSNEVSTCVAWSTAPVKTAADARQHELTIGAAGATSPSATLPRVFNLALGTRFKVISGYPSSANILTALEAGELGGFCSWGWVPMKAMRGDWLREKKFNVLFQIGLQKHKDHPEVPLVLDLADTPQQRQLLELVVAPQTFGRPFAAPPDLPPQRAASLRHAFEATLGDKAYIDEAERLKLEPELVTHGQMMALIQRLYAFPPEIIQQARSAMQ